MRKCLISNNLKVEEILPLLGNNLLKGLDPIVLDGEDKELEGIRYRGMIDKKELTLFRAIGGVKNTLISNRTPQR